MSLLFLVKYVVNYTMQNVFSKFLCFASLFAHLSQMLNNFSCNDENRIKANETTNLQKPSSNGQIWRATTVEGVSKQNSHPFKIMQK